VDYSVPAHELAARVVDVVNGDGASDRLPLEVPLETAEETPAGERALRSEDLGPPSGFTCPDCHGALWEIDDGEAVRYRCRVGHAYSEDAMVSAQSDSVERALWAALRSLEERAALIQKLAGNARRRGHAGVAALFDARSRQMDADIKAIHDVITNGQVLEPVGHDGI
jgi:two-component system chemotaxis response regulator CheB